MTDKPLSAVELDIAFKAFFDEANAISVERGDRTKDWDDVDDEERVLLNRILSATITAVTQARRSIPSEEGVEGSPEASGPSVDVTSPRSESAAPAAGNPVGWRYWNQAMPNAGWQYVTDREDMERATEAGFVVQPVYGGGPPRNTVRYTIAEGQTLAEMRQKIHGSPLYLLGDALLAWVNEGDLYTPAAERVARPDTTGSCREQTASENSRDGHS